MKKCEARSPPSSLLPARSWELLPKGSDDFLIPQEECRKLIVEIPVVSSQVPFSEIAATPPLLLKQSDLQRTKPKYLCASAGACLQPACYFPSTLLVEQFT